MDNATDDDNPSDTHSQPRKRLRSSKSSTINTMPCSYITRLEELCKSTYNTGDFDVAKSAVDTLVKASESGCFFLERYIVMLLDFCTQKHPAPTDADSMKVGFDELLDKILSVKFDKQQLTENLRKPDYKLTSVKQIIHLFRRIQEKLDYRDHQAVDWLLAVLDAYLVELVTTEEAAEIIDNVSAQVDSQCTLLTSVESVRYLLEPIETHLGKEEANQNANGTKTSRRGAKCNIRQATHRRQPFYYIEEIEF